MSRKLHLICLKSEGFHAKIRCNLNDISYLSETQKSHFQFLYNVITTSFVILSFSVFIIIMFSLKLCFELITFRALIL